MVGKKLKVIHRYINDTLLSSMNQVWNDNIGKGII